MDHNSTEKIDLSAYQAITKSLMGRNTEKIDFPAYQTISSRLTHLRLTSNTEIKIELPINADVYKQMELHLKVSRQIEASARETPTEWIEPDDAEVLGHIANFLSRRFNSMARNQQSPNVHEILPDLRKALPDVKVHTKFCRDEDGSTKKMLVAVVKFKEEFVELMKEKFGHKMDLRRPMEREDAMELMKRVTQGNLDKLESRAKRMPTIVKNLRRNARLSGSEDEESDEEKERLRAMWIVYQAILKEEASKASMGVSG
ncbi:hypothetical protein BJ508DRAFT_414202 [Ascobolus immersus RN42]|uniref:Uncharacterized protein n=1 Tax=Ascobolus immersus RN42 TaxID=1160509 RepID=A0A3N4I8H4_ASCIM|nr:hypothetical protein BJ508DRAFT_414202 [Ascobolus immersus RN42]